MSEDLERLPDHIVEAACRAGYGSKWDHPKKSPGPAMKDVWRRHVRKFLEPVAPLIAEHLGKK